MLSPRVPIKYPGNYGIPRRGDYRGLQANNQMQRKHRFSAPMIPFFLVQYWFSLWVPHTHTHTHTHMCTHMHVHIPAHMHIHLHTCMHTAIHVPTCVHTYTHMPMPMRPTHMQATHTHRHGPHACTHIGTCTDMSTYMHRGTCWHTCVHGCTHVLHRHTHMDVWIHTCTPACTYAQLHPCVYTHACTHNGPTPYGTLCSL